MSHRNCVRLTSNTGRGKTCFLPPIVVDSKAFDDRVDTITCGDSIFQTADDNQSGSVAEQSPRAFGIERPAVTIGCKDATRLVQVAAVLRESNRCSTRQCDVTMSGVERFTRFDQRYKRSRTGRVHIDRRTGQIQRVRDSGRDVIFLVVYADLEFTRLADKFRVRQNVFNEVGGRISACPNSDRFIRFFRNDSCCLLYTSPSPRD